jgi:hypothetical protein
MPQYYSLASQGFYEPWKILGQNLQAFQQRKVQREGMAQQQKQFDTAHSLRKEVDKRAQALFDLQLPIEQMKVKEAQRTQRIQEVARGTQLAPSLRVPLDQMTPDDREAMGKMYRRAVPDITPVEVAQIHAQQTPGAMPAAPAGMRATGATMTPSGQIGQVTLGQEIDPTLMGGGAGLPTYPDGSPMYATVPKADRSGYERIKLPDPGEVKLEAVKALRSDAAVKDYELMRGGYTKMNSSYQRILAKEQAGEPPKGADDLALIYSFIKAVDPGSVVREGEIRLFKDVIPYLDRFKIFYNKAAHGVQLTPEVRKAMVENAAQSLKGARTNAIQQIGTLRQFYPGTPENIESIVDLPKELQEATAVESMEQANQLPVGTTFTSPAGKMYQRTADGIVPVQ